jgi:HEPN domain-containing protein
MPLDPVLVADTRVWLWKSAEDLRAAEHDLTAVPPLLDDVLFHWQRAAEKALKVYLYRYQRPFRHTHSMEELGEA